MAKLALWFLSFKLKTDPGYAQGWKDNLACMAMDAGADREDANISAENFMKRVFGVSISNEN